MSWLTFMELDFRRDRSDTAFSILNARPTCSTYAIRRWEGMVDGQVSVRGKPMQSRVCRGEGVVNGQGSVCGGGGGGGIKYSLAGKVLIIPLVE